MGFNAPSKIQETALPTLLADPPQVLWMAFVLLKIDRVRIMEFNHGVETVSNDST
jgi:hypothetical protein